MAAILDLPDECLVSICKKLDNIDQRDCWANVCKHFQYIYYEYLHNKTEVNDDLVKHFGHLIDTEYFPLKTIKKVKLYTSKCSKVFLNKLRDSHPEIEEANFFSFTDEHMAELLPLPNLKVLICIGTNGLRGSSLIELCRLTELHIHTDPTLDEENLLLITYYNPLRVLKICDPSVFSERHAFEMVENLKHLEELSAHYNHCKSWQLIGTLPLLKKLEIWEFKNHPCESCTANPDIFDKCAPTHNKILFDELRKKNQLLVLIFGHGCLMECHLDGIAGLKSLRLLKFLGTTLPQKISLDIFKDLVNLEELHMDGAKIIVAEESLEFIRNCQKLRMIYFCDAIGINEKFILEANDIISQRKHPPLEPITFVFHGDSDHIPNVTAEIRPLISTPGFHIRVTTLKHFNFGGDYLFENFCRKFSTNEHGAEINQFLDR